MITTYTLPSHTTTSGTNLDSYFPSGGAFINTKAADTVVLATQRTAETGTCTLQPFIEYYYASGSVASGLWLPLLDLNNATAVQGVVYADGVLDSSTPFHRFLVLRLPSLTGGATTLTNPNTVHSYYHVWIPEKIRVRFRSGGTTVTNTFSAELYIHTK